MTPTTDSPDTITRWVPAHRVDTLHDALDKLADRARSQGFEGAPPRIVSKEYRRRVRAIDPEVDMMLDADDPRRFEPGYDIEVRRGQLALPGGWTLLGVVDLASASEPLVNVTGSADSDRYFTVGDVCEHCHRRDVGRNKLIVVADEAGTEMAVGTTCVRDFLGHSPEQILSVLAAIRDFEASLDDEPEDERGMGSRAPTAWDTETVVATAAALIERFGYRRADDENATKWDLTILLSARTDRDARELADQLAPVPPERVTAALQWARDLTDGSDFSRNMATIADSDWVGERALGQAAYIYEGFRRDETRRIEAEAQAAAQSGSVHIGEVKERLVITAEVLTTKTFENDWGVKVLVKAITDDGDMVVWWCSGRCPDEGDRITGKATVKSHGDFNGVAETTVQRWSWELA